MKRLTDLFYRQGKMATTKRHHILDESGMSLCGLCSDDDCTHIRKLPKKRWRVIWPKEDLNYCQRCQRSLRARRKELG